MDGAVTVCNKEFCFSKIRPYVFTPYMHCIFMAILLETPFSNKLMTDVWTGK